MCIEFEKMMHKKFQMSSIGELTFFLGLQVTQKDDGIFISQDKYVDEILKKFGFLTVRTASTPMETSKPLLMDENAKDVDVHLYRSMIGSLMYLTSPRPDIMKKHFAKLRAEEIRRKTPTKAQKRNQICTYLKNMANYKHSQLKNKSFKEIQMLFDNTMKWINSFVPMDSEVLEGSGKKAESSRKEAVSKKRTEKEFNQESSKRQKTSESSKLAEEPRDKEADELSQEELQPNDDNSSSARDEC
nr:uncharacterized mitochondrial protein AtMg00810-like [Tanacetum cinerariifolium]